MAEVTEANYRCSKPIFKRIPTQMVEHESTIRKKQLSSKANWKKCVVCGAIPTQMATYPIQGAVIIERYCDSCVEKQFSRSL